MERPAVNDWEELSEKPLSMEDFCVEIADMRAQEESGVLGTAHLKKSASLKNYPGVEANELTLDDAKAWRRIKEFPKYGQVSDADFDTYETEVRDSKNPSRMQFLAFLRNKRAAINMREYMRKEEEEELKKAA